MIREARAAQVIKLALVKVGHSTIWFCFFVCQSKALLICNTCVQLGLLPHKNIVFVSLFQNIYFIETGCPLTHFFWKNTLRLMNVSIVQLFVWPYYLSLHLALDLFDSLDYSPVLLRFALDSVATLNYSAVSGSVNSPVFSICPKFWYNVCFTDCCSELYMQ